MYLTPLDRSRKRWEDEFRKDLQKLGGPWGWLMIFSATDSQKRAVIALFLCIHMLWNYHCRLCTFGSIFWKFLKVPTTFYSEIVSGSFWKVSISLRNYIQIVEHYHFIITLSSVVMKLVCDLYSIHKRIKVDCVTYKYCIASLVHFNKNIYCDENQQQN